MIDSSVPRPSINSWHTRFGSHDESSDTTHRFATRLYKETQYERVYTRKVQGLTMKAQHEVTRKVLTNVYTDALF